MEKKKILFTANDLRIGGIEKALVTLLNYLIEENYDITLVLERKKGELLRTLDYRIKVEEYTPSTNKIILFRKVINFTKRLIAIKKYKNKFDTSVSFATYSLPGSFIARTASINSVLWCHTDYLSLYYGKEEKVKEFFENIKYSQFKKIVFVSNSAKDNFIKVFPSMENKIYQCNNLINFNDIKKAATEKINLKRNEEFTFLNVGRHEERAKKITRIIEAAKKLKNDGYKFKIILVGEGNETSKYKELSQKYGLQNYVVFEGKKENPYPYFAISDCIILSSDYEGYPVVFLESFVLNKPIITTNVSDYEDIKGRGFVVSKSENGIYNAMKKMINEGYKIINKFDEVEYSKKIKDKIEIILE